MNEKPIERLQYYNGERLEAEDLALEQAYHIRVRRWLNKSLYSAGIADGLEVAPDKGNLQRVIVSPGLALDSEGREIILLEGTPFPVVGRQSTVDGQVEGNYLTIQYREETRAEEPAGCTPRRNGHNKGQVAWGGPSRIRAMAVLGWSDKFPHESSGKIVLAQVELNTDCTVKNVYTYPRHYIGPASQAAVRQYALEGERHIDKDNPGRIYFHIRGHSPQSVTLYLRAEKFSTLYYTELGQHNHNLQGNNKNKGTSVPDHTAWSKYYDHTHKLDRSTAPNPPDPSIVIGEETYDDATADDLANIPVFDKDGINLNQNLADFTNRKGHSHNFFSRFDVLPLVGPGGRSFNIFRSRDTARKNVLDLTSSRIAGGAHKHTLTLKETGTTASRDVLEHTHIIDTSLVSAGVTDPSPPTYTAHGGAPLTYVDNLQVYIGTASSLPPDPSIKPPDGENRTASILTQLNSAQPGLWLDGPGNGSLGDGGGTHLLAMKGTGKIRLDLLSPTPTSPPLSFPEGEYYIELRVEGVGNGGRILYNLYVE